MSFKIYRKKRMNRGSRIPAVRVGSRGQFWLTRSLTEMFVEDKIDYIVFFVNEEEKRVRMEGVPVSADAFPVKYQVRDSKKAWTRASINAKGFIEDIKTVFPRSYAVTRVSEKLYEFEYETQEDEEREKTA